MADRFLKEGAPKPLLLRTCFSGQKCISIFNTAPIHAEPVQSVPNMYKHAWHARVKELDRPQEDEVKNLVKVIIQAREPLSITMLRDVLAPNVVEFGLERLAEFLQIGNQGYSQGHAAFGEYINNKVITPNEIREAHSLLANAALKWLDRGKDIDEPVHGVDYAMRHLPEHLLSAECWDELYKVLNDWGYIPRWVSGADSEQGIRCLKALLQNAESRKRNSQLAAQFSSQLARLERASGDFEAAKNSLDDSLHRSRWTDFRLRAVVRHELGSLLVHKGKYGKAINSFRIALLYARLSGKESRDEVAANLVSLAVVELILRRPKKAIGFAQRAIRLADEVDDVVHKSAARRALATAWRDLGNYEYAESIVRDALDIAMQGGSLRDVDAGKITLGWVKYSYALKHRTDIQYSREIFEEGLVGSMYRIDKQLSHSAHLGIALCELVEFKTANAKTQLHAMRDNLRQPLPDVQIDVNLLEALVCHQSGAWSDALKFYEKVDSQARTIGSLARRADALVGMGAINFHYKNKAEAQELWNRAERLAKKCSPNRRMIIQLAIERSKEDLRSGPL